ncbi:MAG: aldehyde dehydrogenase family protein [Gemmatimonadaceae bacterium]
MGSTGMTGGTRIEAPLAPPAGHVPPASVESHDVATGVVWRRYESLGADEVATLVARARQASGAWRATDVSERVARIEAFRRALYRRRHEVAATISRENGKPVAEALAAEVGVVLDMARFVSRHTPRLLTPDWFTPESLALWRKRVRIGHDPYGVIAVISPWNYPFMLPAGIALAAVATGNTVVLKPSEFTPASGELLAELFGDAGVPSGVFSVAQGAGPTGAALVASEVDKVFFTGSVNTGRRVAVACAERFTPCVLELGGSDAAIVLDDADIDHAASGIVWGRFANAGQTCVAPKRIFVERGVYPAFVAALQERIAKLRVRTDSDSEYDVGPLIRPLQREALEGQLRDAVAQGATSSAPSALGGLARAFPPTLLTGVADQARVLTEETFGPLLPVVEVVDESDAVARANASMFGLSASVWSRNRTRAIRIAQQLHSGTVMINDAAAVAGIADVPHGGVKASGTGRSHGLAGLEECVRTHTVIDDRFAGWRQAWWFGYSSSSVANLDGYLRLAHGDSVLERLRGIAGTLRLLFRPQRPI